MKLMLALFPALLFSGAVVLGARGQEAAGATPAVSTQPFGVIVTWRGDLFLSGKVSDEQAKQSIFDTAHYVFPTVTIHNQLEIGSEDANGWSRNGRWGMSQLQKLDSGVLQYAGSYVFLKGVSHNPDAAKTIAAAALGLKPTVERHFNIRTR